MSTDVIESSESPPSRVKQISKKLGVAFGFLLLLSLFTLSKIPDDRIGGLILDKANEVLSSGGSSTEFSSARTKISLFLLGRIRFEKVTLRHRPRSGQTHSVEIDEIRISPSFFDLLLGRLAGSIKIFKKNSELTSSFWITKAQKFSLSAHLKESDLGGDGLGILPLLSGVSGKFPADGRMELSGDLTNLASLNGNISLSLSKSEIQSQKIAIFSVPTTRFNDGEIVINLTDGKARIQKLRIGKMDLSKDDLNLLVSGEVAFGKTLNQSQLNLDTKLKLSQSLMNSFYVLDAVIGQTKQPDGSYAIRIKGPMQAPEMLPGGG